MLVVNETSVYVLIFGVRLDSLIGLKNCVTKDLSCVYSKRYNYDIIKYGYNLRKHIEVLYIEINKEDVYGIQLQ